MSIYTDLKAAGVETDNHESDLYARDCETTRALIKKHNITCAKWFQSQKDGNLWFEIPFHFDPWWEKRTGRH